MSVEQGIQLKLKQAFSPVYLQVVNESDGHNVPPGSESHFKVVIVSSLFVGESKVKRHQGVYSTLAVELSGGVHALAIHTYTPDEWAAREGAPNSPDCMG